MESSSIDISEIIPEPALYEQLAEECTELAQAALKKARKLRGENYTPKTMSEIDNDISEEFSDVMLCASVLDIREDIRIITYKLNRWIQRNTNNDSN